MKATATKLNHRPDSLVRAGDVTSRSLLTARCLALLQLWHFFNKGALFRPDQGAFGRFLLR